MAGLAHERNSASDKCTMINPDGQRHLRDVPSAPIVRSFAEVPQPASAQTADQAARADGSAAEDALTFSTGVSSMPGAVLSCAQVFLQHDSPSAMERFKVARGLEHFMEL